MEPDRARRASARAHGRRRAPARRHTLPGIVAVCGVALLLPGAPALLSTGLPGSGDDVTLDASGGQTTSTPATSQAAAPSSPSVGIAGPVTASPSGSASASGTPRASTRVTTKKVTKTTTKPAAAPAANVSCGAAAWNDLVGCGWPGAGNTGPASGSGGKKTVSGGYTVSVAGAVIDGWTISGGLEIAAKNVTVRNSTIRNSAGGENGSGVVSIRSGASATLDHNLFDGQDATHACVWHEGASLTARYNECTGANDGMFSWALTEGKDGSGDNFLIEGNWFHDLTTQAGNGHIDGYQTEGAKNGVIRHNTFDIASEQNAAVAIWNGRKSSSGIVVERNLIAGGGFSVYAEDYSPSEESPAGGYSVTNIRFVSNVFSTRHFGCVGYFGVWYPRGQPTDGWSRSGNVVLETGAKIDSGNPKNGQTSCT